MKKIKILFTGLSPNMGGIENFLINVYRKIDKNKFEIFFMIFKNQKKVCFYEELKNDGVKFFEVTDRKTNYFKFLKDLKQIYKNNEFDYIHFNLVNFNCPERIKYAYKYSNAKIIIHSHNGNMEANLKNKILHNIGKILIRNIPIIRLACGEEAGKFLFGDKHFEIIHNGIDIKKFLFNVDNRKEIREELKINDDEIVMGLVARFDEQKNHTFLIDLFYEFNKINSNSKLLLIGEGKLKNIIEDKVKDLKLENKIIFLGKRVDVDKIYSALDVYVMPSLFEGLSISIIEAQANGLKCYTSTNVDYNSDISGNLTFISLENSAKKWAEDIAKNTFVRDEDIYNKIPNMYKIEKTVEQLNKIYKKRRIK